jgi:hypothetical protein
MLVRTGAKIEGVTIPKFQKPPSPPRVKHVPARPPLNRLWDLPSKKPGWANFKITASVEDKLAAFIQDIAEGSAS